MTGTAVLSRGLNFTDVEVMEQGPIYNIVTVAPSNTDYGDLATFYTAVDTDSVSQFGARRTFRQLSGVSDESTEMAKTAQYANALLAEARQPRLRISGKQLNVPPTTFGVFWLGDRVAVELHGLEDIYDTTAVVSAMEFSPDEGTLSLVLDVE